MPATEHPAPAPRQPELLALETWQTGWELFFRNGAGLPGNETTRATIDDVDDYHGKTQAIFSDWPEALSSYQAAITVATDDLDGSGRVPIKKITVTVTGSGQVISLSGYRADY